MIQTRVAFAILAAGLLFSCDIPIGLAQHARTPDDVYSVLANPRTWAHGLPAPYRLLKLVAHRQREHNRLFVGAIAIEVGGGRPEDAITLAVGRGAFAARAALTTWVSKDRARRVAGQQFYAWSGRQTGASQDCDPPLPVCYATELLAQQGIVMVAVLSPASRPASTVERARLAALLRFVIGRTRRVEN
jgi:hypothetical protein